MRVMFVALGIMIASIAPAAADTVIDTTEDQKAMAFTDARKIVRDSAGNLYVAYRAKSSTVYEIFVDKKASGSTSWTTMNGGSPISSSSGGFHQRVPAIAIDALDNLHVVWYGYDTSVSDGENERVIKYRKYDASTATWGTQHLIGAPTGWTSTQTLWQEHPVVYVDSFDDIYVVWEGKNSSYPDHPQARYNKSTDYGANWAHGTTGTFVKACGGTGCPDNQSRPTVAIDSTGVMYVFAYGTWSGTQNIVYTSNAGGTFAAWGAVDARSRTQKHPTVAIDSGDKIHIAWQEDGDGSTTNKVIRYSKLTTSTGTFSTAVTIDAPGSYHQIAPSIANYNGQQHAVWTESTTNTDEPTTGKIVYAHKSCSTCSWTATDVTTNANNVWGSIRWSMANMNGGTIDIVYGAGSASPFDIMYHSHGTWP